MEEKDDVMIVGFASKKLVCEKCRYGAITDPENTFCAFYKAKPYAVYCEGSECPHFDDFDKYANEE